MGFFSTVGSMLKANSRAVKVRLVLEEYFRLAANKGSPVYEITLDLAVGAEGTNHNEYDIALMVLNMYSMQLDCKDRDVRQMIAYWLGAGETLIEKKLVSDPNNAQGALSMMADQIDFGEHLTRIADKPNKAEKITSIVRQAKSCSSAQCPKCAAEFNPEQFHACPVCGYHEASSKP